MHPLEKTPLSRFGVKLGQRIAREKETWKLKTLLKTPTLEDKDSDQFSAVSLCDFNRALGSLTSRPSHLSPNLNFSNSPGSGISQPNLRDIPEAREGTNSKSPAPLGVKDLHPTGPVSLSSCESCLQLEDPYASAQKR